MALKATVTDVESLILEGTTYKLTVWYSVQTNDEGSNVVRGIIAQSDDFDPALSWKPIIASAIEADALLESLVVDQVLFPDFTVLDLPIV